VQDGEASSSEKPPPKVPCGRSSGAGPSAPRPPRRAAAAAAAAAAPAGNQQQQRRPKKRKASKNAENAAGNHNAVPEDPFRTEAQRPPEGGERIQQALSLIRQEEERGAPPAHPFFAEAVADDEEGRLRELVRWLRRFDRRGLFHFPVDPDGQGVPRYREIIKNPMDLATIEEKINNKEYKSRKEVMLDIKLIWDNSLTFNKVETCPVRTFTLKFAKQARKWYEQLFPGDLLWGNECAAAVPPGNEGQGGGAAAGHGDTKRHKSWTKTNESKDPSGAAAARGRCGWEPCAPCRKQHQGGWACRVGKAHGAPGATSGGSRGWAPPPHYWEFLALVKSQGRLLAMNLKARELDWADFVEFTQARSSHNSDKIAKTDTRIKNKLQALVKRNRKQKQDKEKKQGAGRPMALRNNTHVTVPKASHSQIQAANTVDRISQAARKKSKHSTGAHPWILVDP